jgi:hypothetical protein
VSCGQILYNLYITGDCTNTNVGEIYIEITGGTSPYTVYEVTSTGLLPTSAATTTYYFSGMSADTYTLAIQDSCISPGPDTIYLNIPISSGTTISVESEIDTICGIDNGEITFGFSPFYGYAEGYLYETTDGYITSGSTGTSGLTFSNLSGGTYYIIGDDGAGCTGSSASVIILTSTTLDYGFYVVDDASCNAAGGSGKIFVTGQTGVGPYTYIWSDGQTGSTATGLTIGYYNVTVTDSTGCSATSGTSVNNVPPIGISSFTTTGSTCFNSDGSVEVTVTGGTAPFFFSGSNGDTIITFSNSYIFENLSSGTLTVTVKDAGLCSDTQSVSLITPNGFAVSSISSTNSNCGSNGSINILVNTGSPTGTFTYTILDSSGNTVNTVTLGTNATFNNLPSDTYTILIDNNSGCIYTGSTTIVNVNLFTITAVTTNTTCGLNNGTLQILTSTGGTLPYSYQITGYAVSPINSYNNLPSGFYTVTVTDANGCSQTTTSYVGPSSSVSCNLFTIQPVNGNDGEITALVSSGTPPFTYNWSSNVNSQTGSTVTNLSAGTYTLQVVDSVGCVVNKTTTLNGTILLGNYQVYNISDTNFVNSGIEGRRGIGQMYNEGFFDLTENDTNCILNSGEFIIETIVNGEVKQNLFYTSTSIYDFPTDTEWTDEVKSMLLSYPDIGEVDIDITKNKMTVVNDCKDINKNCNQTKFNTLADAKVVVNLIINYDISCVQCDYPPPSPTMTSTPTNTPTKTPTPTPTNTLTPTNTPTNTQTNTLTPSVTKTNTPTPTLTNTQTPTVTPTVTPTLTMTPTVTPTLTLTPTPSGNFSVFAVIYCCDLVTKEWVLLPTSTSIGTVIVGNDFQCYTVESVDPQPITLTWSGLSYVDCDLCIASYPCSA